MCNVFRKFVGCRVGLLMLGMCGISGLLSSCMPEPLDVDDVPKVTPEIVVSSQILPDRSLVILLTKTIGAIEASADSDPEILYKHLAITDAVVTINGNGKAYTLQMMETVVYGGVEIPFVIGRNYQLHVASKSLGEVKANTTVQSFINFDSVKAELFFNGSSSFYAQVNYSLTDPPAENFYMINVQQFKERDVLKNVINPDAYTKLVEDKKFNGIRFEDLVNVNTGNFSTGDSLTVSLSNVSPEYYKFMKLRIDNRLSFIEFLSEPINYPTNIIGGKGFFNLYVPDIRLVELKE